MLLHDNAITNNEGGIKNFFGEIHELYVKSLLNPFYIPGTRPGPFNSTPMGFNSISPAHLHVRRMGRTCR